MKRSVTRAAASATCRPPISTLIQAPRDRAPRAAPACRTAASPPCRAAPRPRGAVSQVQSTVCASSSPSSWTRMRVALGVEIVAALAAGVAVGAGPSRSWRTRWRPSRRDGARPARARPRARGRRSRLRQARPGRAMHLVSAGSRKNRNGFSTCQAIAARPAAGAAQSAPAQGKRFDQATLRISLGHTDRNLPRLRPASHAPEPMRHRSCRRVSGTIRPTRAARSPPGRSRARR